MITIFISKEGSQDLLEIKNINPLAIERDEWYGTNDQTFFFRMEDKSLNFYEHKKVKSFMTDLKSEACCAPGYFKEVSDILLLSRMQRCIELYLTTFPILVQKN